MAEELRDEYDFNYRAAKPNRFADNSIAAESNPIQIDKAQRAELARRIADDDALPDDVIPWEQVKAEALAQLTTGKP